MNDFYEDLGKRAKERFEAIAQRESHKKREEDTFAAAVHDYWHKLAKSLGIGRDKMNTAAGKQYIEIPQCQRPADATSYQIDVKAVVSEHYTLQETLALNPKTALITWTQVAPSKATSQKKIQLKKLPDGIFGILDEDLVDPSRLAECVMSALCDE